ncbi:MAG: hypothetical protein ACI9XZ_004652, partial [Alphaproteobacteria bacterium]
MLTQNRANAQFLTSRALTVAIVVSVVLVNSVAWGIPLLVGGSSHSSPLLDSSRMTTGTISKLKKARQPSTKLAKQSPQKIYAGLVPLPNQAPGRAYEAVVHSAKSVSENVGRQGLPELALSSKPSTLFPRPEPRLELPKPPRIAAAVHDNAGTKRQLHLKIRKRAQGVVLVSPYTPGVRISPKGSGHEWRHRNLRVANGQTTLDTAKAIASRAARRFEQMRDKMANLDVRRARGFGEGGAHRRALLPVAPQRPRIAGNSDAHSVSKSARNYVRARLVRRPLAGVASSQTRTSGASRDPIPTNVNRRITRPPVSNTSKSRQVARLTPVVRRKI